MISQLLLMAAFLSTAHAQDNWLSNTCEKNPTLKQAAEEAAKSLIDAQKANPSESDGATDLQAVLKIEVGNIGEKGMDACDNRWICHAINGSCSEIAFSPECGIVITIKDTDSFNLFARFMRFTGHEGADETISFLRTIYDSKGNWVRIDTVKVRACAKVEQKNKK